MRGRILRGTGAGMIGQLLNIVGRLLLVPLFLGAWGAQAYGEWLILSSAAALLAMGDMGGQVYFINRLTAEWARGAYNDFARTLSTGLLLFLLVPTGLFALFLVLALTAPLGSWMGLSTTPPELATSVLLLLALHVVIALPQGLVLGIYRATGAQATSIMLGNAILGLQLIANGVVLLSGGGMVAIAIVQFIPTLLVVAWVVFDLRNRLPGIRLFTPMLFNSQVARESFRPSLHFLGIQFAQALVVQGSVLVIGRTLGTVEVVIFSTIRTLVNLARQVLGLMSHSAWPEFTRLEETREKERLCLLFQTLLRVSMLAAIAYMAVMEVAGRQLMELWLGGHVPYDANVMRLFSIYILLSVFWTLGGNVLMATNRHIALARWQIASSILAIILCYIGAVYSGLAGSVAGLIMGEAVPLCLIAAYLLVRQEIGVNAGLLLREALLFALMALLVFAIPTVALAACVLIGWMTWKELGARKPC